MAILPKLGELAAAIGDRLRLLGDAGRDRPVRGITLAEVLEAVDQAPAGSLILLTRAASAEPATYQFDVAMRRGADRGVGIALASGVSMCFPRSAPGDPSQAISACSPTASTSISPSSRRRSLRPWLKMRRPRSSEPPPGSAPWMRVETVPQGSNRRARRRPGGPSGRSSRRARTGRGELAQSVEVDGVHEVWLVAPEGGPIERLLLGEGPPTSRGRSAGRVVSRTPPIRSRSELPHGAARDWARSRRHAPPSCPRLGLAVDVGTR